MNTPKTAEQINAPQCGQVSPAAEKGWACPKCGRSYALGLSHEPCEALESEDKNLHAELAAEKARADKAEAACAEMRAALLRWRHVDGCFCEAAFDNHQGAHPRHWPECEAAQHALSTSCGTGILAELEQAKKERDEAKETVRLLLSNADQDTAAHRAWELLTQGKSGLSPKVAKKVREALAGALGCIERDYFRAGLTAELKEALALLKEEKP